LDLLLIKTFQKLLIQSVNTNWIQRNSIEKIGILVCFSPLNKCIFPYSASPCNFRHSVQHDQRSSKCNGDTAWSEFKNIWMPWPTIWQILIPHVIPLTCFLSLEYDFLILRIFLVLIVWLIKRRRWKISPRKPFLSFYIHSFCILLKWLRNCTKTKVYILENNKIFNNFRLILNFFLTRLGAHWIINMWEVPSFYLFIALSLYLYLPVLFICYHLPILFCSTFDR